MGVALMKALARRWCCEGCYGLVPPGGKAGWLSAHNAQAGKNSIGLVVVMVATSRASNLNNLHPGDQLALEFRIAQFAGHDRGRP